jgi:hypothetical protein
MTSAVGVMLVTEFAGVWGQNVKARAGLSGGGVGGVILGV